MSPRDELIERARELGIAFDEDARTETLEENLVWAPSEEELALIRGQFSAAPGGELHGGRTGRPRLHSVYASMALALNVFGPFLTRPGDLTLAGRRGFSAVRFDVPLDTGVAGPTPPALDVLAEHPEVAVGVESKLTEHLVEKGPRLPDAYREKAAEMHPSWAAILDEPFAYVGTAQLVKQYLGLKRTGRPAVLLYLHWRDSPEHAEELARFAAAVDDPDVEFAHQSHQDLWRYWEGDPRGTWLPAHVRALERRYG